MEIHNFDELMNYIEDFENNPEKMQNLKQNAFKYLRLCNKENAITFLNKISESNIIMNVLSYNLSSIYMDYGMKAILIITKNQDFPQRYGAIYTACSRYNPNEITLKQLIDSLLDAGERDYIIRNMPEIISSENIKILLNDGIFKKLKEVDESQFRNITPYIVASMTGKPIQTIDKDLLNTLCVIVNQLVENEELDMSDLEYVDRGSTSEVFRIGSKVIKFGIPRNTNKIPYHRRILQPLIRRNIKSGDSEIYVEIAEYIEQDNTITDEDVYQIYKELRDEGIVWIDCKKANVGRLIKDNSEHYKEPLNLRNETVGYIHDTIKEYEPPIAKGKIVILDTDLIVREEDLKNLRLNHNIDMRFFANCEGRYQKEKAENTIEER